ncbi:MAG: hypothetical protein ACOX8K_03245 [Lachnospiraceae bacterium]
MLNEEKIRLMTEIAMFEKKKGKRVFPYHKYFKSDYIGSRIMRSFFNYTLCALMCLLIWGLYNLDKILNTTNFYDLIKQGKLLAGVYLAGLILYLAITVAIASYRYQNASKGMREYAAKLRRLEKRYEFQSKTKEIKEGSRL